MIFFFDFVGMWGYCVHNRTAILVSLVCTRMLDRTNEQNRSAFHFLLRFASSKVASLPRQSLHNSHTVAPTIAPTSQKPEYSRRSCLAAPLVVEEVLVSSVPLVPFGRVPLMISVLVPFTFPM